MKKTELMQHYPDYSSFQFPRWLYSKDENVCKGEDENIDIASLINGKEMSLTTLRNIARLEQEYSQCKGFSRIIPLATEDSFHLDRYYPNDCYNDRVLQSWISYKRNAEGDALEKVSKLLMSM